jgi:hypothetical protein
MKYLTQIFNAIVIFAPCQDREEIKRKYLQM